MKLYFHPMSQNARKVRLVASLLGLSLEERMVDLMKGEQHGAEFLALNPNGLVPVLVDGDFVLWESNAICQYLASLKKSALWPSDARQQASVLRWQSWETAHWFPALFHFFRENMLKKLAGGQADPAELAKGEAQFDKYGNVLDRQLGLRPWLVGDTLSLADIAVGSHLMHATAAGVPVASFRHLARWFDALRALPAWRATEPGLAAD
jgi:glutathione S-transferase